MDWRRKQSVPLSACPDTLAAGSSQDRVYVEPPQPRSTASRALIWTAGYMRPFTPVVPGGRNVECCIKVIGKDGKPHPCGATLKHNLGTSTTNLLKHIKVKHPKEAELCLEASKHSGLYKAKRSQGDVDPPVISSAEKRKSARSSDSPDSRGPGAARPPAPTSHVYNLHRGIVLHYALDLRPWHGRLDPGLGLLLDSTTSLPSPFKLSKARFDEILQQQTDSVVCKLRSILNWQRQFIPFGPCASIQIYTWTLPSSAYVYATMTGSCVTSEWQWHRSGLSVRAFHKDYTTADIEAWIQETTSDYFDECKVPCQVFLSCTTNRGKHLKEAISNLGITHIPCSLDLLGDAVEAGLTATAGGSSSSIADFVQRLLQVARSFLPPNQLVDINQRFQQVLGVSVMDVTTNPNNLKTVLELMRRMLSLRSELQKTPARDSLQVLSGEEWLRARDALGVLEACDEVDRGIRSEAPPPMLGSMSIMKELQYYLSEDVLYVPDLDRDIEADRLEANSAELDTAVQHMQGVILRHIQESDVTNNRTSPPVIACLLDPKTKSDSTLPSLEESDESWSELIGIYQQALSSLRRSVRCSSDEPGSSSFAKESVASPFTGTHERQAGRRVGSSAASLSLVDQGHSEISAYQHIPKLRVDVSDSLQWWKERHMGRDTDLPTGAAPQLLPLIAAQYLSIDPSTCEATALFSRDGYLVPGLERTEPAQQIQNYLFLRLNRQVVERILSTPSAPNPGSVYDQLSTPVNSRPTSGS
eukprot:CAMPEP_0117673958 /NCGR_PEP_ID=MMETSP0804-20121206/14769_1 /TAXON_ID=1074897 /ORGANISM="Tetraselmis astigmatica, Strain CCMP880" /LENGTH=756 /DNA_ID=CAMNT_0005482769 /DNA_START=93 /DNA_END=2363 /DNA_ORIENTATION=+